MSFATRSVISISVGLALIFAEWKLFPVSWEPVIYWSLPAFHLIFRPWESGPNPKACLCALVFNSVLVTAAILGILSIPGNAKGENGTSS